MRLDSLEPGFRFRVALALGLAPALVTACHSGRDSSAEAPSAPAEAATPTAASSSAPEGGAPSDGAPAEGPVGGTPGGGPGQASSAECEARKADILGRFTEAARCEVDSDCTTMLPGCPFGCGLAINTAADLTPINEAIAAYNRSCNRCMYRCRPIEQPPVCRAGLCSLDAAQP